MTKKKMYKGEPKAKAITKAAQPSNKTKKAPGSKASKLRKPKWLKSSPTEYIVGTEDYGAIIDDHNKLFGTDWLKFRVRPQVFYTIHQRIWDHYHG